MIIKFGIVHLVLSLICFSSVSQVFAQTNPGNISTICIDAGHGGVDPGAIGLNGTKEKNVTLNVALRVGELLKQYYPTLKIVYTRSKDSSVDLKHRTKIANKAGADLFLSIHTNAFNKRSVRGVETYVLGSNSTQQNLAVAMKENAAIRYEEDYTTKYEGFDPNKPESYIIFNLMQNVHLEKSVDFASFIQRALVSGSNIVDRDVRQAPFWVLKDAAMPAVLVEIGYISNVEEERILRSKSGQEKIAQAIVIAFKRYKSSIDKDRQAIITPPTDQLDTVEKELKTKETISGASSSITSANTKVTFAIQICSSTTQVRTFTHINVKEEVKEIYCGGRYRYYVSPSNNLDVVMKRLLIVKKSVKDCFPIAIYKGELIPLSKAKQIQ